MDAVQMFRDSDEYARLVEGGAMLAVAEHVKQTGEVVEYGGVRLSLLPEPVTAWTDNDGDVWQKGTDGVWRYWKRTLRRWSHLSAGAGDTPAYDSLTFRPATEAERVGVPAPMAAWERELLAAVEPKVGDRKTDRDGDVWEYQADGRWKMWDRGSESFFRPERALPVQYVPYRPTMPEDERRVGIRDDRDYKQALRGAIDTAYAAKWDGNPYGPGAGSTPEGAWREGVEAALRIMRDALHGRA